MKFKLPFQQIEKTIDELNHLNIHLPAKPEDFIKIDTNNINNLENHN
ncbi:MAG: hypothetical protein WC002_00850 [Candidatus Muiribacteriota bacterium]